LAVAQVWQTSKFYFTKGVMQLNLLLIPVFLVVISALYIFLLISMREIVSVTLSINELTLILKIISQCDKHIIILPIK
jgi:hypothetical protein